MPAELRALSAAAGAACGLGDFASPTWYRFRGCLVPLTRAVELGFGIFAELGYTRFYGRDDLVHGPPLAGTRRSNHGVALDADT